MVTITSMEWNGSAWAVSASVVIDANSWCGTHVLDLPETADEADIRAAVLALYTA